MSGLEARLSAIRARLSAAAQRAGRDPADVKLLAVSKTQPPEQVCEAVRAGLRAFGENRVQEAEGKIPAVQSLCAEKLEWHLIGGLQRNKARRAVELCDVIQSVDRLELLAALEKAAAASGRHPRIFLQVNVDAEPQKSGCAPGELAELARAAESCSSLHWVGLMAIPRACADPEQVRPSFARLRALLDDRNRGRPPEQRRTELSMGMTADFEIAVEEGSTWVRLGTALFGARETG